MSESYLNTWMDEIGHEAAEVRGRHSDDPIKADFNIRTDSINIYHLERLGAAHGLSAAEFAEGLVSAALTDVLKRTGSGVGGERSDDPELWLFVRAYEAKIRANERIVAMRDSWRSRFAASRPIGEEL